MSRRTAGTPGQDAQGQAPGQRPHASGGELGALQHLPLDAPAAFPARGLNWWPPAMGGLTVREGEGPLALEQPPNPGRGDERPRSGVCKAGSVRALEEHPSPSSSPPSLLPARHPTSEGTGRFSVAAFSSSTESVCLSVSGAVVSGLQSQRASFSRASHSATASAIAAAPRPSAAAGLGGSRQRGPGHFRESPGFHTALAAGRGRAEYRNPEMLPQSVGGTEVRIDVALNAVQIFRLGGRGRQRTQALTERNRTAPTGSLFLNFNNFIVTWCSHY